MLTARCFVTADSPATGGDGNHILLIFDTMGGPRKVLIRDLECEVFEGRPSEAKRTPPKPAQARRLRSGARLC